MSATKNFIQDVFNQGDEGGIHPIQVVARRTGISADVIRAWERRYSAVIPQRSATNRRLYSDQDVQRLRMLNQAIALGRRIGDVAHLPLTELSTLIGNDQDELVQAPAARTDGNKLVDVAASTELSAEAEHIDACLDAIAGLQAVALEAALAKAALNFSTPVLLEGVILQVLDRVGQRWQDGELRLCHEHMATAAIRSFLGAMISHALDMTAVGYAPLLLVTTPSGQRHELGAIMVALVAAHKGWQPLYLGSNTPADEIAYAVTALSAQAVALSICYPADDPHLPQTLKKLRRQLPTQTPIIVGGASAPSYQSTLDEIGAVCPGDLSALQTTLDQLRR